MTIHKRQSGFTLIELAVVLFIIGLLLGGVLGPLRTQIELRERNETEEIMAEALEAIIGFALATGRLPCPDTDFDGSENRDGTPDLCSASVGALPASDLGVETRDAWQHRILYRVTADYADAADSDLTANNTASCTTSANGNTSFELCSVGDLQILDSVGGNIIADAIPVVLISRGNHRWLPNEASADEQENYERLDLDATGAAVPADTLTEFVSRDYADDFDDIVLWLSPHTLRQRMLNAGRLP